MLIRKDIIHRIVMEVFPYLPGQVKHAMMKMDKLVLGSIEEIRFRGEKPVMITCQEEDGFLHEGGLVYKNMEGAVKTSMDQLAEMVYKISENSWYAYQEDINHGFITIRGGHRIGLIGTPVIEDNRMINVRDISSVNVRIAREVTGCGEAVVKHMVRGSRDIYNTVIISPPGLGKTTLLRDIIRLVSSGFEPGFIGLKTGVVDERGELAASCRGVPQNNLGWRTDVIQGITKKQGMEIMLRSMSPHVLALDELGNPEEVSTLMQVMNAGIRIIATAHGYDIKTLKNRQGFKGLFQESVFERFIVISTSGSSLYEIHVLDGDENVLSVVCQDRRMPAYSGKFNNGRICILPAADGKNRVPQRNSEAFIGIGE